MRIRLRVPYDDGKVRIEQGKEGRGLSDEQKRRLVRVGLADEIKPKKRKED